MAIPLEEYLRVHKGAAPIPESLTSHLKEPLEAILQHSDATDVLEQPLRRVVAKILGDLRPRMWKGEMDQEVVGDNGR